MCPFFSTESTADKATCESSLYETIESAFSTAYRFSYRSTDKKTFRTAVSSTYTHTIGTTNSEPHITAQFSTLAKADWPAFTTTCYSSKLATIGSAYIKAHQGQGNIQADDEADRPTDFCANVETD